jgi:hypothetical protein
MSAAAVVKHFISYFDILLYHKFNSRPDDDRAESKVLLTPIASIPPRLARAGASGLEKAFG